MGNHAEPNGAGLTDQPAYFGLYWCDCREKPCERHLKWEVVPFETLVQAKDWAARFYPNIACLIVARGMRTPDDAGVS